MVARSTGGGERPFQQGEDRVVFIVDDDARVRESLTNLLESAGMEVRTFARAEEFVAAERPDCVACLLLDVDLPEIDGLELQRRIAGIDHPPIVFITGFGNIPSTVAAIKAGAVDFLSKPVNQADLLRAIHEAFERDAAARAVRAEIAELRARFQRLTRRERQVLPLIVAGLLNKQAAAELGISLITLQVHRGQIMRKMQAGSLAELVRMAVKLEQGYNEDGAMASSAEMSARPPASSDR